MAVSSPQMVTFKPVAEYGGPVQDRSRPIDLYEVPKDGPIQGGLAVPLPEIV